MQNERYLLAQTSFFTHNNAFYFDLFAQENRLVHNGPEGTIEQRLLHVADDKNTVAIPKCSPSWYFEIITVSLCALVFVYGDLSLLTVFFDVFVVQIVAAKARRLAPFVALRGSPCAYHHPRPRRRSARRASGRRWMCTEDCFASRRRHVRRLQQDPCTLFGPPSDDRLSSS